MGKNLIQQRRGKGSSRFRAPSFKSKGKAKLLSDGDMKIIDFIRSNLHSAPLAVVQNMTDASFNLLIAPEGVKTGDVIHAGKDASLSTGNALALKDVPEGTPVFNIEAFPGDGGKFVRSSGATAKVMSKIKNKVVVQLPSKKKRVFNENCRACIGVVAGSGRKEKPLLKAGNKFKVMHTKNKYWPKVSGASMNAVDHPFGGKRSSRKGRSTQAGRFAPPGRKVGMIRPKKTGRGK